MFDWLMSWFRPRPSEPDIHQRPDWRIPCEMCRQVRYTTEVVAKGRPGEVIRLCQSCWMASDL